MSVIIAANAVSPIEGSPRACVGACGRAARWFADYDYCAWCLLYKTSIGTQNADGISALIQGVQDSMAIEMCDATGKLKPEHADRILYSIVLLSKLVAGRR